MGARQPGPCLWCGSADVHQIPGDRQAGDAARRRPHTECRDCGRQWTHLPLKIRRGEVVETRIGPVKAADVDVAWLRPIRASLLKAFAAQRPVDAAGLKAQLEFPHELNELPRLLALLAEDCARRGEPSLADMVTDVPATAEGVGDQSTVRGRLEEAGPAPESV